MHRHEPPVTSLEIGVIHEDNDLLVIDKPAGVPVHSAGRYHYNSIIEILRAERGYKWHPRPCNRLDRLTSGVMFIGKHPKAAEAMSLKLKQRTLQKEYVARVKGKFPDGVIICDQPIMQVSPKLGLNRVRATGKEAKTEFRSLAYYHPQLRTTDSPILVHEQEGYSIVHCLPLTGRTHQIRVHLQFLGHPITNDPIYSNRRVFGPGLGKSEDTPDRDHEIIDRLSSMGKTDLADDTVVSYRTHFTAVPAVPPDTDKAVIEEIMSREHEAAVHAYHQRKGARLSGENCDVCGTELYTDPNPHELGIFLHAVAYADNNDGWKYTSKMPAWGMPPDGMSGPCEVPDWVPAEEGEAVLIGRGAVPEGLDDNDDDLPALVQGVGMVDISPAARRRMDGQEKNDSSVDDQEGNQGSVDVTAPA